MNNPFPQESCTRGMYSLGLPRMRMTKPTGIWRTSREINRRQTMWMYVQLFCPSQEWMDQFSLVQLLSFVRLFASPWTAAHQASCPSPTPGVHLNPCPSSRWCHPTISSSVDPFSSCPQSLPASGSFPMSQLFTWGGKSIGVSASASVLLNTQDWSPLGWTGWISLQSKGLSRVFSNKRVQKDQFFSVELSL